METAQSRILKALRRPNDRSPGRARFELATSYVSLLPMSWKPGRGLREVSQNQQLIIRAQGAPPFLIVSAVQAPVIEQETREQDAVDLPWQVVVHNDPVNLMSYVTMVFQKVFGFNREKAEKHMLEVHQQGRSIVWSGLRERAELYVQQLHGYLLLATLERIN